MYAWTAPTPSRRIVIWNNLLGGPKGVPLVLFHEEDCQGRASRRGAAVARHAGDSCQKIVDADRFREHSVNPLTPPLFRIDFDAESAHQNDGNVRMTVLHRLVDLPAGDTWHGEIRDHEVEIVR